MDHKTRGVRQQKNATDYELYWENHNGQIATDSLTHGFDDDKTVYVLFLPEPASNQPKNGNRFWIEPEPNENTNHDNG